MPSQKVKITLKENGVHSLLRGLTSYQEYEIAHDKWRLKEAVMFLHHGVELLMKEILVRRNEYLIFEDLEDVTKKQKKADKLGMGIFFLDPPPKTVSYDEALSRVEAFVRPPQLSKVLLDNLGRLNQLRNQLEHYEMEASQEEVMQLFAELRDPLLDLFEAQVGGVKQLRKPKVNETWSRIQDSYREITQREREVFQVVQLFRGQRIPGYLLGAEGEFTLPSFTNVVSPYRIPESGIEFDIYGETRDTPWVIEIKILIRKSISLLYSIYRFLHDAQTIGARPWLVVFGQIPKHIRRKGKQENLLITGSEEWRELKKLLEPRS